MSTSGGGACTTPLLIPISAFLTMDSSLSSRRRPQTRYVPFSSQTWRTTSRTSIRGASQLRTSPRCAYRAFQPFLFCCSSTKTTSAGIPSRSSSKRCVNKSSVDTHRAVGFRYFLHLQRGVASLVSCVAEDFARELAGRVLASLNRRPAIIKHYLLRGSQRQPRHQVSPGTYQALHTSLRPCAPDSDIIERATWESIYLTSKRSRLFIGSAILFRPGELAS